MFISNHWIKNIWHCLCSTVWNPAFKWPVFSVLLFSCLERANESVSHSSLHYLIQTKTLIKFDLALNTRYAKLVRLTQVKALPQTQIMSENGDYWMIIGKKYWKGDHTIHLFKKPNSGDKARTVPAAESAQWPCPGASGPRNNDACWHVGTAGVFKNLSHSRLDTKVTKGRVWSNKEQQGVPPKLNALQLTQLTQLPGEPSSSMRRCAMLFGPSAW